MGTGASSPPKEHPGVAGVLSPSKEHPVVAGVLSPSKDLPGGARGQSPFIELIKCPVCLEVMGPDKLPKQLPCEHTMCKHCVDSLQVYICPICTAPFPQNSSYDLSTHLSTPQLIDVTKTINKSSKKKLCELCPLQSHCEISHFCNDCNDYFCPDCAKKHPETCQYHTTCYNHTIPQCVVNNICTMHQRTFTMFCLNCNILLCLVCAQNKVCCISKIKKNIKNIKIEKTQELKRIVEEITSIIQFNNKTILPTRNTIAEIKLQITTQTQKLQDRLNKREKELMDKINKYEAEIDKLQRSVNSEVGVETFTKLKQTAEAVLVAGTEQILLTLPSIKAIIPQSAKKLTEIMTPGKIIFNPEESMNIGNIHTVLPNNMNKKCRSGNCVPRTILFRVILFRVILV